MRIMRDQDSTTSIISLGILANGLSLLLTSNDNRNFPFKADETILNLWKTILEETIAFIQTSETKFVGQVGRTTHFLSRAEYLEQIYVAAPDNDRKTLKRLALYLEELRNDIVEMSEDKPLNDVRKARMIAFSESLAREAIKEASVYHQEAHIKSNPETDAGIRTYADIS